MTRSWRLILLSSTNSACRVSVGGIGGNFVVFGADVGWEVGGGATRGWSDGVDGSKGGGDG